MADDEALVVSLDGFEGPLDVLLALARTQKVDLAKISVLALADQYLVFIAEARKLRLELAADYLVMAAWLAYLKSQLLLPREAGADDQPTGEELAARLAFRLKRLEAMRNAAAAPDDPQAARARHFRARHAGGRAHHPRARSIRRVIYDLLKAYAEQRRRTAKRVHVVPRRTVWSIKEARAAAGGADRRVDGQSGCSSSKYLEQYLASPDIARTAVASSFGATLEMAREGLVEISQAEPFAPIYVRKREDGRRVAARRLSSPVCRVRRSSNLQKKKGTGMVPPKLTVVPHRHEPEDGRDDATMAERAADAERGAGARGLARVCRPTSRSCRPPTGASSCGFSRRCCLPPPSRWPSTTCART